MEAWSFGRSSLVAGDGLELAWGDFDLGCYVTALVGCRTAEEAEPRRVVVE